MQLELPFVSLTIEIHLEGNDGEGDSDYRVKHNPWKGLNKTGKKGKKWKNYFLTFTIFLALDTFGLLPLNNFQILKRVCVLYLSSVDKENIFSCLGLF